MQQHLISNQTITHTHTHTHRERESFYRFNEMKKKKQKKRRKRKHNRSLGEGGVSRGTSVIQINRYKSLTVYVCVRERLKHY